MLQVDGGAPLDIDGRITLCGRSNSEAQRGYTGLLAELALFDAPLTEDQAAFIYSAVREAPKLAELLEGLPGAELEFCIPHAERAAHDQGSRYCLCATLLGASTAHLGPRSCLRCGPASGCQMHICTVGGPRAHFTGHSAGLGPSQRARCAGRLACRCADTPIGNGKSHNAHPCWVQ